MSCGSVRSRRMSCARDCWPACDAGAHTMINAALWTPSPERIALARITAFAELLREKYSQRFPDYWSLWRWSIANKEVFWRELWDFCGIVGDKGERTLVDGHLMPGAQWFPDAQLNFAENLLKKRGAADALVFWNEQGDRRRLLPAGHGRHAVNDQCGRYASSCELLQLEQRLGQLQRQQRRDSGARRR